MLGTRLVTFSTWVILAVFVAELTACVGPAREDAVIDQSLNQLLAQMQPSDGDYRSVKSLQSARTQIQVAFYNFPQLSDFTQSENEASISRWLDGIDAAVKPLRELIYGVSKSAFFEIDKTRIVRRHSVLFFGLHSYRQVNRQTIEALTPLMLALGDERLKDNAAVIRYRSAIMTRFMTLVGANRIIENDLAKITRVVGEDKTITHFQSSIRNAGVAKGAKIKAILDSLPPEQKTKFANEILSYRRLIESATFLYEPGQNMNSALAVVVWGGNLTWGLLNSAIGLGIVLATVAVSPFTPYVDFPTFRLAKNKAQIYVDVTGMSPFGGKLSMGIFELSNGGGYSWASEHEGVHAIQSALLGPLYVPAILVSYLIAGFDEGFFEDWAWDWADRV